MYAIIGQLSFMIKHRFCNNSNLLQTKENLETDQFVLMRPEEEHYLSIIYEIVWSAVKDWAFHIRYLISTFIYETAASQNGNEKSIIKPLINQ